jgi:hypothetical protein
VLKGFGRPGAALFKFWEPRRGEGSRRLQSWGDSSGERAYTDLSKKLSRCRRILVHDKPVFLLTRRIPRPNYVENWSGLAAICRAVQDKNYRYAEQSEVVTKAFDEYLRQMRTSMASVWNAAATALEPLMTDGRYCNAQLEGIEEDKNLTLKQINNFLAWTRMGGGS